MIHCGSRSHFGFFRGQKLRSLMIAVRSCVTSMEHALNCQQRRAGSRESKEVEGLDACGVCVCVQLIYGLDACGVCVQLI